MIKDKILFYKDQFDLKMNCYFCNSKDHLISECLRMYEINEKALLPR